MRCGCRHHRECFALHGQCAVFGCPGSEEELVNDDWTIDPDDPVPLGEQISRRILYAIARGVYQAGDKLPTVRDVAKRLRVNPNTVSKAYRDLERDGMLVSRRGTGVFVHTEGVALAVERRQSQVLGRCERAIGDALDAGLDPDEILAVVSESLRRAARARGMKIQMPAPLANVKRWPGRRVSSKRTGGR